MKTVLCSLVTILLLVGCGGDDAGFDPLGETAKGDTNGDPDKDCRKNGSYGDWFKSGAVHPDTGLICTEERGWHAGAVVCESGSSSYGPEAVVDGRKCLDGLWKTNICEISATEYCDSNYGLKGDDCSCQLEGKWREGTLI